MRLFTVDLGHGCFFAPKCGKITIPCALLVWKLGPREAEIGPKLSSTMYHLYVITVQYAYSSCPSIACRHGTWMLWAPKYSPMTVLHALLLWSMGCQEAENGPTMCNAMYIYYFCNDREGLPLPPLDAGSLGIKSS